MGGFGAFLTALGTVLGHNIGTLITFALVGGGLYLGGTKRGRLIIKAVGNYLTSNATNNPRIAAGVFDEKLKELREMKKKVVELNKKAQAALLENINKEEEARREYKKLSSNATRLERAGNHDDAVLVARQAQKALRKADDYLAKRPNLQVMADTAKERLTEVEWKISDIEERKELAIDNIEKGKLEQEISEELQSLDVSEIDASIKSIESYSEDQKYLGAGARMTYENSEEKMLKSAMDKADYGDAESFLKELMDGNDND